MSRTIEAIYNSIIAEKQTMAELNRLQPQMDDAQTLLDELSSSSKVAIWRLFFWVVAVAIWTHEKLWDNFSLELDAKAEQLVAGTKSWYWRQCFLFQYGDNLQWIDNKYQYSQINTSNQIIKRAAVIEASGQLRFKVAKLNGSLPVPLSTAELTSFSAYIEKIKFAGTNVAIISDVSDDLIVGFRIYYNPLVLSPTGELINSPGVFPVEDAIVDHISNLTFDGVLSLTSLTDAVQQVEGVVNPILTEAKARYGGLPYTTIADYYNANAGHMTIESAIQLSDKLIYVKSV